ncbi:MAG TPA: PKD domain-containing protein, partial [Thermoplasmatales archaeon]|nr:PKD domain-containing protein [Thermoplasmatales archaeon]
ICVDCQPDTGYNYAEDAHNNFRYLAYKTGGSVFGYESEGVADEIINRVLREERSFYFIQLTDTHYGYDGARKRVKWLIKSIAQLNPKPAFVIISGDLLSWGADSDNMPLLSWPFTEEENNSYSKLKEDLEALTDTGIPYYVCIGNHDYRHWPVQTDYISGWIPYYLVFGNLRYSTTTNDLHIVALNSGPDNLVAGTYFPPKGRGLSEDDLNWLENDLDSLDGIMNGRDDSKLKKLIFMHHPTINYMDDAWPFPGWGAGCISNNRQEFMNLCTQYNVDAILSGHIHWNRVYDRSMDGSTSPEYQNGYNDGSGDPAKFPLSTFDKTLYVDTGAAYLCEYRMIKCKSDGLIVWREDTVIDTVTGKIYGCPVILHLYDEDTSHVGRNEMGGVDFEIENTTYLLEPVTNTSEVNPAKWNHTIEEISLPYGIDTYRYEIEAMGNGSFNFSLDKHLTDGSKLNLLYRNISVTNGSKGILYVAKDSIDYTIYFDDNRDGVIDREIQPDNVVTNNVPYRPEKPNGPPLGDVGVLYTYSTSTMDPEGDQVYYWWDWGDGTNSGWLGPYYSGEVIEASHVWNEPGVYEIKVKAKDGYGHVSDWSPSLTFQTDITPPITTKTIAEPKYGENDEWVTSDTRFNLTATDDISGVKATYYRIWYNGTWSGWLEYTGNFILFGEGKHYLEYYSVDNAGNQEEIHNQTHYVDDTPPVTIISLEYGDGVTWVFDPETGRMKPHREIRCVTLIADDNGGVDHCIVYWATRDPFGHLEWHSHPDSVTFKGDIVKNVAMFYSVDALSNREEPRRADRAIPIF